MLRKRARGKESQNESKKKLGGRKPKNPKGKEGMQTGNWNVGSRSDVKMSAIDETEELERKGAEAGIFVVGRLNYDTKSELKTSQGGIFSASPIQTKEFRSTSRINK